jgi:hypothetical protein
MGKIVAGYSVKNISLQECSKENNTHNNGTIPKNGFSAGQK